MDRAERIPWASVNSIRSSQYPLAFVRNTKLLVYCCLRNGMLMELDESGMRRWPRRIRPSGRRLRMPATQSFGKPKEA
jgi:hypothetical protein